MKCVTNQCCWFENVNICLAVCLLCQLIFFKHLVDAIFNGEGSEQTVVDSSKLNINK